MVPTWVLFQNPLQMLKSVGSSLNCGFKLKMFRAQKLGFLPICGKTMLLPSISGLKTALKTHFWVSQRFRAPPRLYPRF